MLNDALSFVHADGQLHHDDFVYLGFIERAQAFHLGVISAVEQGNPLAAVTLLRAYAENVAAVFWIARKPQEFDKLRPGAKQKLPIGRVIAEAEKHLPGFKSLYDVWSDHAHPSGAGGYHTLAIDADGHMTWQSHPKFRSVAEAQQVLDWLDSICALTARIIVQTAKNRRSGTGHQ